MGLLRSLTRTAVGQESDQANRDDGSPDAPPSAAPDRPTDTVEQLGMFPEEYVRRVICAHGGRMLQQDLVEETGWTEPTVSRLLSEMETDGLVVRRRIGRQKAVGLP